MMHYPRIVFMGTPEFAAYSLKMLSDSGHNIVGVITSPDKPAGRGQKISQSAVKKLAIEMGHHVLQPKNLKDPQFIDELRHLAPDIQVVVAFRMLPELVWTIPPRGSFNLHASLLPSYRGAAPINWAVINGETLTGVTTFFLEHEIDTGNIIFQEPVEILIDDTAGTIHDKLMRVGARLVVKTVQAISSGTAIATPQDNNVEKDLKSAPKIFKDDCRVNWAEPAISLYNKIRGLSPYPAAWTNMHAPDGSVTGLKIYFARVACSSNLNVGETWSDGKKKVLAGTASGDLELTDLQVAGKKRLPVGEFLKGNRWPAGTVLI